MDKSQVEQALSSLKFLHEAALNLANVVLNGNPQEVLGQKENILASMEWAKQEAEAFFDSLK